VTATLSAAVIAMEDAGFILGSYAITFGVIGAFAVRTLRRGRRFAERVGDEHKYWT
jgi:hypothetical protein